MAAIVINGVFFAAVSGPYGRYHLRALGLAAAINLLAMSVAISRMRAGREQEVRPFLS